MAELPCHSYRATATVPQVIVPQATVPQVISFRRLTADRLNQATQGVKVLDWVTQRVDSRR